jgi:hypothetical protein
MSKNVWAMFGTMPSADDDIGVQACIERAFTYLSEQDQSKFRKRFRTGHGDGIQHTFRELLAGVFVTRQGFTPCYSPVISGQTPDWHFKREGVGEFLAEFRNLQSPDLIGDDQKRKLEGDGVGTWGSGPQKLDS